MPTTISRWKAGADIDEQLDCDSQLLIKGISALYTGRKAFPGVIPIINPCEPQSNLDKYSFFGQPTKGIFI